MNIIGIIRLAKGQVGYYDEKTNIHLTLSNPVAQVYDIMNTENLKKSIRYKTIELVSGSLDISHNKKEEEKIIEKQIKKAIKASEKPKEEKKEEPIEEKIEIEIKEEKKENKKEVVEEPKEETTVEEPVAKKETKTSKRTTKKNKTEESIFFSSFSFYIRW